MKTLVNAKHIMRRTMGRILTAAALSAIAFASVPAQAADKTSGFSDAVYRTSGSQSGNQSKARLVPADFSVGINFGHGIGNSRYGYYGNRYYGSKFNGGGHKFRGSFRHGNRRFSNRFRNSNRRFSSRFRGGNRRFSSRFRGSNRGFRNRGFRGRRH